MITLVIDNQEYEVEEGQNLLQACLSLGLDLPYFCWHPSLNSIGACRQCAVTLFQDENDTRGRLGVACMTPVSDGMIVSLTGAKETEFREQVISALMTNHPHDCPVCAEGGECHLQDMTVMTGHHSRNYKGLKRTHNNQYLGPLIKHEMNRCITCYRCVRFYNDYAGGKDLSAQASKSHVYFGREKDGNLQSPFAGNLTEVCPTGVFTDKTFGEHFSRKWDLLSAPSICHQCSLGCNITLGERYGSLRRITNRLNKEVNGHFICDRGRFATSQFHHPKRVLSFTLNGEATELDLSHPDIQKNLRQTGKGRIVGVGSGKRSIQNNFALKHMVGEDNFCSGFTDKQMQLASLHQQLLVQFNGASIEDIEQADAIVILCEDIGNTAPRAALAVRQAQINGAREFAKSLGIPDWQELAVKQLVPDHKTPVIYLGYGNSWTQQQCSIHQVGTPQWTAKQAANIAFVLDPSCPEQEEYDEEAHHIAGILRQASRPLVICGWQAGEPQLLAAAQNLMKALNNDDAKIFITGKRPNELGQFLVATEKSLSIEKLLKQIHKGQVQGLICLDDELEHFVSSDKWQDLQQSLDTSISLSCHQHFGDTHRHHLHLPCSSQAEEQGTLVNNEGRVQHYYPVLQCHHSMKHAWQWLSNMSSLLGRQTLDSLAEIEQAIGVQIPQLAGVQSCSSFTVKMPRQTHRASGRTAMLANQTVHEPKPGADPTSHMSFTMEGQSAGVGKVTPFSWSPGWNSNQSGFRTDGDSGVKVLHDTKSESSWNQQAYPFKRGNLLILSEVMGSDETANLSHPLNQLSPPSYLAVNSKDTSFATGDMVVLEQYPDYVFQIRINDYIPEKFIACYVSESEHFWPDQDLTCRILAASDEQVEEYTKKKEQLEKIQQEQHEHIIQHLKHQDGHIPVQFITGEGNQ